MRNGDRAVIHVRKIVEYCLSDQHDDGKHKARLVREVLGITLDTSQDLVDALQQAAAGREAEQGKLDRYGQRYVIDFAMQGPAGPSRATGLLESSEEFRRKSIRKGFSGRATVYVRPRTPQP